jgi:hypothetical protein
MNHVLSLIIFVAAICVLPQFAHGEIAHPEKWYQENWCREQSGQIEAILPDKTRCDCLTHDHAIEFDFGPKWAEAIGQALYYGLQTGKQPGIVLIIRQPSDYKYWLRLNSTIEHYHLPIQTWKIEH